MTLFQMVLKELIIDKLYPLIANLQNEIESYDSSFVGYDKELSGRQKKLVEKLMNKLRDLKVEKDDAFKDAVIGLVDETRAKITIARTHFKHDLFGDTLPVIESFAQKIKDFYVKLDKIKEQFDFLNYPYKKNPANIIYYHAVCYLGKSIFTTKPKPSLLDSLTPVTDTKTQKELILLEEIIGLKKELMQTPELVDQAKVCEKCIGHILLRNKEVVKLEKNPKAEDTVSTALSLANFFSKIPIPVAMKDYFALSTGKLGLEFKTALYSIQRLEEKLKRPQAEQKV